MDNPFRPRRPASVLGCLAYPARWLLWRLNRPAFEGLARLTDAAGGLDPLWQLANYTRTHADNVHRLVMDQQGRVDELVHLANYTRTHADNIHSLVRDAHTRADHLEARAGEAQAVAQAAVGRAEAAQAAVAALAPPHAISPLMAQAITLDHVALARRIAMLEAMLVDLQAQAGGDGAEAAVLSMTPHRRAA